MGWQVTVEESERKSLRQNLCTRQIIDNKQSWGNSWMEAEIYGESRQESEPMYLGEFMVSGKTQPIKQFKSIKFKPRII